MLPNLVSPTKTILKERKKSFIDMCESRCRNFNVSNKNLGVWIRAYHFNLPLYIYFAILLCNKSIATISLIHAFIIIFLFIYLDGCWLSMLEKRICDDDINIVDFWIEWSGTKIAYHDEKILRKQRLKATMIIGSSWLFLTLLTYYLRFLKTSN